MNILLMSMPDAAPVVMHESAFHMPNLGIAGIGANLDQHHDITLVDLIRKRRHIGRYLRRLLKKTPPDVVGLSTMTWQYDTCINIIRFIRRRLPGVYIVIGGYHPTLMYDEIGQSADADLIDFMIRGEGETAFCRLLRALEGTDELNNIPGLSYKDCNQFIHNPRGHFSTIARDCGVSSQTIKGYFQILEDTLLGRWLPSYRKRPKRRVAASSKFYFADVGVVNFLAKRRHIEQGSELFGKAFENWCFHELNAYNAYQEVFAELYYWRLAGGTEVDFIVNDMQLALESKAVQNVSAGHLKGLRSLKTDHPTIERRVVICCEDQPRVTDDGIEIIPAQDFVDMLWHGDLF